MRPSILQPAAWVLAASAVCVHAQQAPDTILFNGKIVTVDDFFTIQEAVAVQGERFTAVGTSAAVRPLAGAATRVVDLGGRTVIPGLIDNHIHVIRATEYWPNEARLDGVTNRAEALALLEAKAGALPEGEWLMTLGGWTENQFIGDQADFTLEELDAIAPDRPAYIQSTYDHAFANSAWFTEMGVPLVTDFDTASPGSDLASHVVRDGNGAVTGRLNGGMAMINIATARFPEVPAERQADAIRDAFSHFNSIGLTTAYDPGGGGIRAESYERIWALAAERGLTLRVFHTLARGAIPTTLQEALDFAEEIRAVRPFQGDATLDLIAVGENYYIPFQRDSLAGPIRPTAEAIEGGREILTAAADGGWPVQTHSINPDTINTFLDFVAEVNERYPLRQLRWSITHADRIERAQVERLRHLGMNVQIRSISVTYEPQRVALLAALGEAGLSVPPLRMLQDSGIPWGLGTDGTKAAQINPFVTLWWAVTGLALNGETVLRETLTREEALIAHTRSNAYLMFQEANLGSIRPGLMADMLVLDRDYLTVPASEIKDIRPVATIVGGQVVWGAL